jgi:hypothetical protein
MARVKKIQLHSLLTELASDAAALQDANGAMPAGHNGPYRHLETPVRNTAHWLFMWCQAYLHSDELVLRYAAEAALDFLLSELYRYRGFNWQQRYASGRDACNGVIGASWVIEALCVAANVLEREDAFLAAEQVFLAHPVDPKTLLWHRLEPDGRSLSVDRTLNHQLWLAAAGSRLAALGSDRACKTTNRFLDELPRLVAIRHDGMILHRIQLHWWDRTFEADRLGYKLHRRYVQLRRPDTVAASGCDRDMGYHAYNLHAMATIKRQFPDNSFWKSDKFLITIDFVKTSIFADANTVANPYSIPYNPVGFECAWALETFSPHEIEARRFWLEKQINALGGAKDYGLGTTDPRTVRARLYEASELKDIGLHIY